MNYRLSTGASTEVFRRHILPLIQEEANNGKNFARLVVDYGIPDLERLPDLSADKIPDAMDKEPNTPIGAIVDMQGKAWGSVPITVVLRLSCLPPARLPPTTGQA